MSKKHVYNSTDGLVLKALRGAVAANPALRLHEPSKVVFLPSITTNTIENVKSVAVISGGGAGHEPAHAGYVGRGMLSAAVSGDIFASPNAKQVLKAIELAAGYDHDDDEAVRKDVLVVINNYTGDILNFGLAIEKFRSLYPSISITSVVVADDVALLHRSPQPKFVGPRGLGANILVCKVLGALSETGVGLDLLKSYGDALVSNLHSLGVGLEHCHIPGRQILHDEHGTGVLGTDECEIGLGLHNEPGAFRVQLDDAAGLINKMSEMLFGSREGLLEDCKHDDGGVVLFINNLGGLSQLEMSAVANDVVSRFNVQSIRILRLYCSSYMTSLNAPGFSISIVNVRGLRGTLSSCQSSSLVRELLKIKLEDLLDAQTEAIAWVGGRSGWDRVGTETKVPVESEVASNSVMRPSAQKTQIDTVSSHKIENAIRKACTRVLNVRQELTDFDTVVGDGDCGETFAAGANAIIQKLNAKELVVESRPYHLIIREISDIIEDSMGGTIGALLGIYLNALSGSLSSQNIRDLTTTEWKAALTSSLSTLSKYTPAEIGDRTIMDALMPFSSSFCSGKPFADSVVEGRNGAEKTRGMVPKLGRATYSTLTGGKNEELPPDPGAWGVCAILEGLAEGLGEEGESDDVLDSPMHLN